MSMRVNSLRDRQECQPDMCVQSPVGIGFARLDGYFSIRHQDSASASDSFQPRSLNAQTTSGDLQPGAGTTSHRERPNWLSLELPVLFRKDRERTDPFSASSAFARHAQMHGVRSHSPLYRGSSIRGSFTRGSDRTCSCTRFLLECTSIVFSRESQPEFSLL